MLGQYILESSRWSLRMIRVNMLKQHSALLYKNNSSRWSLRMIRVNMLKQHSALLYKNNNQKLYNIYILYSTK